MLEKIDRVNTVRMALQAKEAHEEEASAWIHSLAPFKYENLDEVGLWLLGSLMHTVNPDENIIIDKFTNHLENSLRNSKPSPSRESLKLRTMLVKNLLHRLAWPKILRYNEGLPPSEFISVLKDSDNSLTVGDLRKLHMEELKALGVTKPEMTILWRLFLLDVSPTYF